MPGFHDCTNCNGKMPIEDSHTLCVVCLGPEHAVASRADPSSCPSCASFSTRTLSSRVNKVAGGNGSVSSRASSDGGSPRAASFETKVGENKESASHPSGKKHRKRKHEAYEALATTMTSLAKEVSSLAVNL